MDRENVNPCGLCGVDPQFFIPKTVHSNKWFKARHTREEMGKGIQVCKQCHSTIHDLIPSEKELGRYYNTLEKLLNHPAIRSYVEWKRKKGRP